MAGKYNNNLFLRNILLNIYKQLHISILICIFIKQSLFSRNVLLLYDVNYPSLSFLYDITAKVAFLNKILNDVKCKFYTGLFISPSGISELDCATTKTGTAERSISTERERHSKFLSYLTGARYVHPW